MTRKVNHEITLIAFTRDATKSLPFGTRGMTSDELMLRIAQDDMAECAHNARTVASTVLMHFWQDRYAEARARVVAFQDKNAR